MPISPEFDPEEYVYLNDLLDAHPHPGRRAKGLAYNIQTKLEAAAQNAQPVVQSEPTPEPPTEEPHA